MRLLVPIRLLVMIMMTRQCEQGRKGMPLPVLKPECCIHVREDEPTAVWEQDRDGLFGQKIDSHAAASLLGVKSEQSAAKNGSSTASGKPSPQPRHQCWQVQQWGLSALTTASSRSR